MNNRCRKRQDSSLSMTPMIDVVFLLLIFFLAALKPSDTLGKLGVKTGGSGDGVPLPPIVTIEVTRDALVVNGAPSTENILRKNLLTIRSLSKERPVLIVCRMNAIHSRLMKVLDICAECKIDNVALASSKD